MGSPGNKQTSEKQTQTKRRHEFDREQVGVYGRKSGRLKKNSLWINIFHCHADVL